MYAYFMTMTLMDSLPKRLLIFEAFKEKLGQNELKFCR